MDNLERGANEQTTSYEELEKLVGKRVKIKDTPNTKGHGIAGGPGEVESVAGGKLQVIYTDKTYGPSGPYPLDRDDVEVIEKKE